MIALTVSGIAALLVLAQEPHASAGGLPVDAAAAGAFNYCVPLTDDPRPGLNARLDSGTASEAEQARALLILAGVAIAEAQPDFATCETVFEAGAQRFEQQLAADLNRLSRQGRYRRSRDRAVADIQARIRALWLADQAGRFSYLALQTGDRSGAEFWAQRLATANAVMNDAVATEAMRAIVDEFGWIDRDRFGSATSTQAWLLVQHADDHPDFQQAVLDLMAASLDAGGVRRRDYAFLQDRVLVNTGQPQRYGTQPEAVCNEDGTLDLRPVEDPDGLDARRTDMGLGPVADDLAAMARERCRSSG